MNFRLDYADYIENKKWNEHKFDLKPYLPLHNMDLSNLNLRYLDFEYVELKNVNFENCYLDQVKFTHSHITNCNFNNADMRYTKFDKATLINNSFEKTLLSGAGFINAKDTQDNTFQDNDVELEEIDLNGKHKLVVGATIFKEQEIDIDKQQNKIDNII